MSLLELLLDFAQKGAEIMECDGVLKVIAAPGCLAPDDVAKLRSHKPDILNCFQQLGIHSNKQIEKLTPAQRSLWLVDSITGSSEQYNMPIALKFSVSAEAKFDKRQSFTQHLPKVLAHTLTQIVQRHGILRTNYVSPDATIGEPLQIVRSEFALPFEHHNLSPLTAAEQQQVIHQLRVNDVQHRFDLSQDIMLRATLLTLSSSEAVLLLNMHHIAADGWSMGVLVQALNAGLSQWVESGFALEIEQETNIEKAAQAEKGEDSTNIQYTDYSAWLRNQLSGENGDKLNQYWLTQLADLPPLHSLPLDKPRSKNAGKIGDAVLVSANASLRNQLLNLAQEQQVSLFMLLNAAFTVFLHRYSTQVSDANGSDIVFGTTIANREQAEIAPLMGYFVNSLVIRNRIAQPDMPFTALLAEVKQTLLAAYEHQQMPFESLVEKLNPERDASYNPLFQIMLSMENVAEAQFTLPNLNIDVLDGLPLPPKFDLSLNVYDSEAGISFNWQFDTALFERDSIAAKAEQFLHLLSEIVAQPDTHIASLPLLSTQAKAQLLASCRAQKPSFQPLDQSSDQLSDQPSTQSRVLNTVQTGSLVSGFEAQVANYPDRTALVFSKDANARQAGFASASLSYQQLNQQANQLAHALIQRYSAREELKQSMPLVGLCVPRSAQSVIGILGILKAGLGYLPLDPNYPASRLAHMVQDSGISLVVSHSQLDVDALGDALGQITRINIDEVLADSDPASNAIQNTIHNPEQTIHTSDLAYVIYTSGSTGKPKGVAVEHGHVMRLFQATAAHFAFSEQDVWSVFHSFSFDFSVWELWGALLHGGSGVIVPSDIAQDTQAFYQLARQTGVTVLSQTPSAFEQVIREDASQKSLSCLRYVVFGGEALNLASLQRWVDRYGDASPELVNMYGITETTVHVTYKRILAEDIRAGRGSVIGAPLQDLSAYVLDSRGELLPPGAVGELYVGGAGVTRGYWNNPELTAERFVQCDLWPGVSPAERLYKTGDLVRLDWGDGKYSGSASDINSGSKEGENKTLELVYMGRIDQQIQLRGFRIELGEIDHLLLQQPDIAQAFTMMQDGQRLVSYVVPTEVESAAEASLSGRLRTALAAHLPQYMIPSAFVSLSALPTTANGKVDRARLPVPSFQRQEQDPQQPDLQKQPLSPSLSETALWLRAYWADLLSCDEQAIHADSDFFLLGGHSLLATQLVSQLNETLHQQSNQIPNSNPSPNPNQRLSVRTVFENSRLSQLANVIDALFSSFKENTDFANSTNSSNTVNVVGNITPKPEQAPIELSLGQQVIWYMDRINGESSQYNMPLALKLKGKLQPNLLHEALNRIVARHQALRTVFPEVAPEVAAESPSSNVSQSLSTGVLLDNVQVPFEVLDLRLNIQKDDTGNEPHQSQTITNTIAAEAAKSFDLTAEPLLRAVCMQLADDEYVLIVTLHHIAADAWSIHVLCNEVSHFYQQLLFPQTTDQTLHDLPVQYADFSYWQRHTAASHIATQLNYWQKKLANMPLLHSLPLDFPRPAKQRFIGQVHHQRLSSSLSRRLHAFANERNISLFMLMESAFSLLLARWSRSDDIVIGCPLAGRTREELAGLIGYFVNVLPLRSQINWEVSVNDFLAQQRDTILQAFDHQDVPFDTLVETLRPEHSLSHNPLVQIIFSMENTPESTLVLGNIEGEKQDDVQAELIDNGYRAIKYDMNLSVSDNADGIGIYWNAAADLFAPESIAQMAQSYEQFLQQMLLAAEQPLASLSLLSIPQRLALESYHGDELAFPAIPALSANAGHTENPSAASLLACFAQQVQATPHATAMVFAGQSFSFVQVQQQAQQLAQRLLARGLTAGAAVGVCLPRSPWFVVSFWALQQCRMAYVPLDTQYPQARLQYMMTQAQVQCVITQQDVAEALELDAQHTLLVAELMPDELEGELAGHPPESVANSSAKSDANSNDCACILFTSGSTGQPKGVVMENHSLVNFHYGFAQQLALFEQPHSWIACASFSFDASLLAMSAMCHGCRVVLPTEQEFRDPVAIVELLRRYEVGAFKATVSLAEQVLSEIERELELTQEQTPALTQELKPVHLCLGGEMLSESLWQRLRDYSAKYNKVAVNAYGPTETTINASYAQIDTKHESQNRHDARRSIGAMMPNIRAYVLDKHGNRLPSGAIGELHIGGRAVTRGYLSNDSLPENASERFQPDSFATVSVDSAQSTQSAKPAMRYQTGDLVRVNQHGDMLFMGRDDGQIKLRGYRIETGEIDACLAKVAGVENALVTVQGDDINRLLVAYVQTAVAAEDMQERVMTALAQALPVYMLPGAVVCMAQLPSTANGKIDRNALPAPQRVNISDYQPPQTATEQQLADIWQQLLQLEQLPGKTDDFFRLGGHSLLATRLANQLNQVMPVAVSLRTLYEKPQLSEQAAAIDELILLSDNQKHTQADNDMMEMEW